MSDGRAPFQLTIQRVMHAIRKPTNQGKFPTFESDRAAGMLSPRDIKAIATPNHSVASIVAFGCAAGALYGRPIKGALIGFMLPLVGVRILIGLAFLLRH